MSATGGCFSGDAAIKEAKLFFKVAMIVRLTKDPEMRYTPSGTAVTNLSTATSKTISKESTPECPAGWKDSYNGKAWECTIFPRITVWGKQAESCNEYLKKGSMIYVEAELAGDVKDGVQNPRVWTGNDGMAHANYEYTARLIKFLNRAGASENGQTDRHEPDPVPESEIPF